EEGDQAIHRVGGVGVDDRAEEAGGAHGVGVRQHRLVQGGGVGRVEDDVGAGGARQVPRVDEKVDVVEAVDGLGQGQAGEIAGLDDLLGGGAVVEERLDFDRTQAETLGEAAGRHVGDGVAGPGL